ncbi:hypothetical protein QVD17_23296 [Tagetes erecta]|uniref:Uncharacterized protein n=1 Tax=Tagetes erecta TaxID=13708 RepID=A0AAD8KDY2_TARER|nr:hypothetical protein QVD17_23296 [Tagetes erecta]
MGTKFIMHHVKEESIDIPSIPPGFESFAAFPLKRVDDSKLGSDLSVSTSASEPQPVKKESGVEPSDNENIKRPVRPRLGINNGRLDSSSSEESESEQNQASSTQISKGVIRGCEECHNC